MEKNYVSPYNGEKPYIFVSFSHRNQDETLKIVSRLKEDGFRVWYDEGIDPGTEWDENIAAHVESCEFFLALLSEQYLDSSNCKDELNYARELEKNRVLIYLENVELPGGMKMRLSRLQAIHKYTYADEDDFFRKLYMSPGIEACREPEPEAEEKTEPEVEDESEPVLQEWADSKRNETHTAGDSSVEGETSSADAPDAEARHAETAAKEPVSGREEEKNSPDQTGAEQSRKNPEKWETAGKQREIKEPDAHVQTTSRKKAPIVIGWILTVIFVWFGFVYFWHRGFLFFIMAVLACPPVDRKLGSMRWYRDRNWIRPVAILVLFIVFILSWIYLYTGFSSTYY